MAALETLGLSIQRFRFSETSQIVHFLTKDWGRIVCLVKGAYRPKNNFKGNIDLMELSRITFIRQKGSAIYLLRARKLMGNYPTLHKKIDAFAQSCLVTELLRHGVQEHQKIPGLFELVLALLDSLEAGKLPHQQVSFFFQGMFLRMLGYAPVLDRCVECRTRPAPGRRLYVFPKRGGVVCSQCRQSDGKGLQVSWAAAQLIMNCISGDLESLASAEIEPAQAAETWAFYALFLQYFLEKEVKAYAFLKDLALAS